MFVDIFKGYLSSNIFIKRKESQQAPEILIFNAYEGKLEFVGNSPEK